MKRKLRHSLSGMLVGLLGVLVTISCGDADDPDAVDVRNLKYASDLDISDNGDGTIRLSWRGSNFEDGFQGYNVYGIKMSDSKISELASKGLAKGTPLQLLDDEGEARSEAKDILLEFNYNGSDLNSKKDQEPTDDEERKISYLPIHKTKADGTPVLPSCYPDTDSSGNKVCKQTEESTNLDDRSQNGTIYFDIDTTVISDGLSIGEQYCFLVFSVRDDGEEISQTSTNFECVIPRKSVTTAITTTANSGSNTYLELKVRDLVTECAANGCPDIADTTKTKYATYVDSTRTSGAGSSDTGALYIESYSGNTNIHFVAGKNCGIKDYGYRTGFSDSTLPTESELPTFENEFSSGTSATQNSNGYSLAGQSLRVIANNLYLLACTDTSDSTKVFYHWLYAADSTSPTQATSPFNLQMRLAYSSR